MENLVCMGCWRESGLMYNDCVVLNWGFGGGLVEGGSGFGLLVGDLVEGGG